MRLLHTSDWHLGRQLHGHDLAAAQQAWVDHLVETAVAEGVDAVLISGDVHDRALPPVEALTLFAEALGRLRDRGIQVVAISGNHDSAARLGDKSALLDASLAVRTDPALVADPVLLSDAHGGVSVYAVPYLEPVLVRGVLPGEDGQEAVPQVRATARAMRAVAADRLSRGGRAVVLAHGWVSGGAASDSERDLGVGGVGAVPLALFDGFDYVALGHLHRPQALREDIRYSGSPLAYSFSEAADTKVSWLVELGPAGLTSVEAVPAPVPRPLSSISGTLSELLTSRAFDGLEDHFISATYTDAVRPQDVMLTVQRRFPFALHLDWRPVAVEGDGLTYAERTRGRTDVEIVESFLGHVRGPSTPAERAVLHEAMEAVRAAEVAA